MIFPLFVAVDEYIAISKEKHGYNMEQVHLLCLKAMLICCSENDEKIKINKIYIFCRPCRHNS